MTNLIINEKITEAIRILKSFDKEGQLYWLETLDLCNSEKGFIMMYLGHCHTL